MRRHRFDEYIARFNERDQTAFDEFLTPDMHMQNGTLEYTGVQGMKDHYAKIWSTYREELLPDRFVSDDEHLAIRMLTRFTAFRDDPGSMFGPVTSGETFEFRGVILYTLREERFADILVAYNSFVHTDAVGHRRDLGIPH
jgi:hypothetical protein